MYSYTNNYLTVLYPNEDYDVETGPNDALSIVWTICKFFYTFLFKKYI